MAFEADGLATHQLLPLAEVDGVVVVGVIVGLVVTEGELGLESAGFNIGVVDGLGFSVGMVVIGVVTSICQVEIVLENAASFSFF